MQLRNHPARPSAGETGARTEGEKGVLSGERLARNARAYARNGHSLSESTSLLPTASHT